MATLKRASDPVFIDAEHSQILLRVEWVEFPHFGEVAFVADPTDEEAHGRDIFARALTGEFGAVKPYADIGK